VLHTRENLYEAQPYRVPGVPAPVRGLKARRIDEGVELTWPFRLDDVAYRVHRRAEPGGAFARVSGDIDERMWIDREAGPDDSLAYSVTALTNETGFEEGSVNFGDYLVFSVVESGIAEEVLITPLLGYGKGSPIEKAEDARPAAQSWRPNLDEIEEQDRPIAQVITERIDEWESAFVREDLDAVMDLYATEYQDLQGWRFQYARRAYQWFFERYSACRAQWQVRSWDFSEREPAGRVHVVLYARFSGVATTDSTGRFADREAYFPRTPTGETRLTFVRKDDTWRLLHTDPAVPNFKDILSFSAGPYDAIVPGPDVYAP